MQWMYFVNHYDNWSGSTQRKHISELEDMGTASQIAEACNYLCDEEAAGRHGGLFTFLAAMSGLAASHSKTEPRFHVGDHVRVRYRGQEGTIIDINGGLYMVSLDDGNYIDSFEEGDLEKAR